MEPLGVVVGVDGNLATVGMYQMSNDAYYLWDGDVLVGPKVGAYVTILQNDIKIIATVESEKVMDQQNSVKSEQFDNRYRRNSINRILVLKTQGVIEDDVFILTNRYVPMIGNEVKVTTIKDLNLIYSGIDKDTPDICIGRSIREGNKVYLPINSLFASHIGIFGVTGSGKSNTLHKLYHGLFTSKKINQQELFKKSKFFLIDFNGEYTDPRLFGVDGYNKTIFKLSNDKKAEKIPILKKYFLDADFLSILFKAKSATQIPFLRNSLRDYEEKEASDPEQFSELEFSLFDSLFKDYKSVELKSLKNWLQIVRSLGIKSDFLCGLLREIADKKDAKHKDFELKIDGHSVFKEDNFTELGQKHIKALKKKLSDKYKTLTELSKFKFFIYFRKIYVTVNKITKSDYINPLTKRIELSINRLDPFVQVVDDLDGVFKSLNIISLSETNQEIKKVVPMLVSRMMYDLQKHSVSKAANIDSTCHLIIDEAHNLLNYVNSDSDDLQRYRLSVFERIIKEGRKFGFFLTICSQRPSDISPTVMSQLHNFFIHRLINENDIKMLRNTVPTLSENSFKLVSGLGQGEVIVTGSAINIPIFMKVDEATIHPQSDDVILTDLWNS